MKSSPPNLAIAFGCASVLMILFCDFQMPNLANQTEFVASMLPAAHLALGHQFPAMYNAETMMHQAVGIFATSRHTFMYPPICAMTLTPLTRMPLAMALLTWQGISLLALSYCVFLIGKAASRIDAASGESENSGWYALMFFPTLMSLWSGNGDIIFGILPLTFGYYFTMTKKYLLAGVFFALCLCKPACLLPGFVTAFALLAHKRPRCMAGLLIGGALTIAANALVSWAGFTAWLDSIKPAFHLSFATEQTKSVQEYIANLPQALLLMMPDDKQVALASLSLFFAGGLLVLALYQIVQMQKNLKEDYQIVPLTFVTGLYLIPLVIPGVNYSDLSIMVLIALVIASLEWRKFSDWRLKTTVRVTAIAINAFGLLVIFQPKYAYPLILIALLLIYLRRIVEAVHLAASEHGGVEKVFAEAQEEFLD